MGLLAADAKNALAALGQDLDFDLVFLESQLVERLLDRLLDRPAVRLDGDDLVFVVTRRRRRGLAVRFLLSVCHCACLASGGDGQGGHWRATVTRRIALSLPSVGRTPRRRHRGWRAQLSAPGATDAA